MRIFSTRTFRIETAVIAVASASVVALAFLFVQDVIGRTQGALRSAAEREVASAAQELEQQYEERSQYNERPLQALPFDAQDLSLRGLSQAVLRSYSGVQGGFYDAGADQVIGVAGAQERPAEDELRAIHTAVRNGAGKGAATAVQIGGDLLVVYAIPAGDGRYAWALRRLAGARDPAPNRRRWLLATVVLAAVVGVAGIVSISVRLRRGVDEIKETLQELEVDFMCRPRVRSDDFGEIHAAISKMADRRMELETSLRRQDRLAALGKVVAGVAHEIRNPLNSMRLQLELLKRKIQKGAASSAEVEAALQQVDRLNLILSQLLAFGKPDTGQRCVQDIEPLARHAIHMVQDRARAKRVEVRLLVSGRQQAEVDGIQIEQVLTNLLLNAVEASPEDGEVQVRIGETNGSVEVQVSDHGSGIPDAIRDHVFDAFFTTRADGTGLGLSVSREIVAAHGGSLEFTSAPGGTTFLVRLPARRNT